MCDVLSPLESSEAGSTVKLHGKARQCETHNYVFEACPIIVRRCFCSVWLRYT